MHLCCYRHTEPPSFALTGDSLGIQKQTPPDFTSKRIGEGKKPWRCRKERGNEDGIHGACNAFHNTLRYKNQK
jgi:hypothetical protein